MSLPRKAVLGPFTYTISDDPRDWIRYAPDHPIDNHWGLTLFDPGVILLRRGMNPTMTRAILLHELLHAATMCAGAQCVTGRKSDEQWATLAAPALLDTLTRSPGLAEFLFGGGR